MIFPQNPQHFAIFLQLKISSISLLFPTQIRSFDNVEGDEK